jgi:hypothetical protein
MGEAGVAAGLFLPEGVADLLEVIVLGSVERNNFLLDESHHMVVDVCQGVPLDVAAAV